MNEANVVIISHIFESCSSIHPSVNNNQVQLEFLHHPLPDGPHSRSLAVDIHRDRKH